MKPEPQIKIRRGDRLLLWNGETVTNNIASYVGDTHVNVTGDDGYGIPMQRTGVVEVWRNGVQIWPPKPVQLSMFER